MKRKILDALSVVALIITIVAMFYMGNIRHIHGRMVLTKEVPCAIIILITYFVWAWRENRD